MEFIKGMDISMIKELEHSGATYRLNEKEEDLFHLLKECGTNMVRIRIWPDPYDEIPMEVVEMICRRLLESQKERWKVEWILCWTSIIVIFGQIPQNR